MAETRLYKIRTRLKEYLSRYGQNTPRVLPENTVRERFGGMSRTNAGHEQSKTQRPPHEMTTARLQAS
jgi:hypothetical protein